MDDLISRQAAIEVVQKRHIMLNKEKVLLINDLEKLPSAQPDNGLQKLADEIASFKRCVKSENSDYFTGYLSALSVVEGMIVRGENNEDN